jgi:uncharacterized protein with FMN-binding domain
VAVLAVYTAGYVRTQSAAEALDLEMAAQRAAGRTASASAAAGPSPLQQWRDPIAATSESTAPVVATVPVDTASPVAAAEPVRPAATPADPVGTVPPADSSAKMAVPAIPEYVAPSVPPPQPTTATASDSGTSTPKVPKPLRDGAFHGYGSSRHGDIEVRIEVAGGKVVYAEISRCLTRWSCSIIEKLPAQVIERQTADVDIISGATASSDAFYMAVLDAFSTSRGK